MGIRIESVTLHVGPGTFQPVRSEDIAGHRMEEEWYNIPKITSEAVNEANAEGRRVVAVGTTVVRTLESTAADGRVMTGEGSTDLFIYPGYGFQVVDALLTNFHLPRSTLLMLVCAFAGRENVLKAYREAVHEGFRFYSYGDAMFIA
jgi:S-adenosylmethionine:tRNA ribosyltransferase-isomerase